jgi:hypothetical protein
LAKRAGCITAFGRLFDKKYQFVHWVPGNMPLVLPTISSLPSYLAMSNFGYRVEAVPAAGRQGEGFLLKMCVSQNQSNSLSRSTL